jgi:hypothetical protein
VLTTTQWGHGNPYTVTVTWEQCGEILPPPPRRVKEKGKMNHGAHGDHRERQMKEITKDTKFNKEEKIP